MTIPNWYDAPFTLRESWIGALQPVVGLVGLDVEGDTLHRRISELLNLGTDLAPTFILNPNLPRKKARREGLEQSTYIPEGLLPLAWADKHRSIIPAVIVVFFKDDAPVTVNKALGKLRDEATAFGTQILVMLIKGPGEEESASVSTERASALCAAADIPPKSLYILVNSHPDRIHASVHRLERGIREACTAYYAGRVRRLKSNKERSTQLALHIRYNLKLAFFFEIRRDYASSLAHYEMATEGLTRLGAGLPEVKVIGAIVNYRLCRIHLLKREWAEVKTKFQRHVDIFRNSGLSSEHGFEVAAFLEQQYQQFGDLAKQYYTPESNNALDPVSYFIVAAKYAQHRAELVLLRRSQQGEDLQPPPAEELYPGWEPKFLGQRPWSLDQETRKLPILLYFESLAPHSELVIKHLGLASEFCKEVGRLRTRCQLMSMMGDEFLRSGEFARCILLMAHVLREFGKERWSHLLLHCAQAGLSAAISLPDVSAYLNFVVVLQKKDLRPLLGESQASLLASNLEAVIIKRVPQHEGLDVAAFTAALAVPEGIKSYVGVHSEPFLSAWIRFGEETVSVHRTTRVLFHLQNRHETPVFIKSIAIQTNIPEYDVTLGVGRVLDVGQNYETTLEITPKDSNKVIQLQVGVIDIGKDDISVLLHYSLVQKAPPTLWNEWSDEGIGSGGLNVVKVEGSRPLLQCSVERDEPALVGEAHAVTFIWTNTDTAPLSRCMLTFFLSTTNPHLVRLSPDPGALESVAGVPNPSATATGGGGLSHSVEVDKLGPGASTRTTLYLRVLGETELRLISKAKYVDSVGQGVSTDHFTQIVVVPPFSLTTSLRDSQGEVSSALTPLQPFVLLHQIANVSGYPLILGSLRFQESPPHVIQHGFSGAEEELLLQPLETFSALQFLQLCKVPLPTDPNHISCLAVQWSRDGKKGEGDGRVAVVNSELFVPIPRVTLDVEDDGLYLTGEFGKGELKRPMSANYVLLNRSQHCWDLSISIDSTEYFMNAGPKKMSIKLNGGDHINLSYILFPLKTGLVSAPRLVVEGIDTSQTLVIHRDHPKTIFVRRLEEPEITTA